MIERILAFSVHQRWLVVLLTVPRPRFGVWSLSRLPIDAVPDITNNQVQINTVAPALSPGRGRKAGHVPDRNGARRDPGARIHALAVAQRLLAGDRGLRREARHLFRPAAGR